MRLARLVLPLLIIGILCACGETERARVDAPPAARPAERVTITVTSPGRRIGAFSAGRSWTVCGDPTEDAPAWPSPEACAELRRAPELLAPIGIETQDVGPIDEYVVRVRADDVVLDFPQLGSGTRRARWAEIKRAISVDAWEQATRSLPAPRAVRPVGPR